MSGPRRLMTSLVAWNSSAVGDSLRPVSGGGRNSIGVWCVGPAVLLVVVTTALNGLGLVGSKYMGVAWAFLPMVTFAKSQVPGRTITAVYLGALAIQGAVHWVVPNEALALPDGPPWIGPFTWTLMLGLAMLVGLRLGAKSRRSSVRTPAQP